LEIDWSLFEVQGKDLHKIPIQSLPQPKPTLPKSQGKEASTGTELVIRHLRQGWSRADIIALRDELAILTPPFKGAGQAFRITLLNDVDKDLNGPVESAFLGRAEIEFYGRLDTKGGLHFRMSGEGREKNEKSLAQGEISLEETSPVG
jgi:hypothetical protein